MALLPAISGSKTAMSAVGGRTIVPRIRTSRPDEGSARCNASRAQAQPRNFSQPMPPSTTSSTSNATSRQPKRIAPSAPRRGGRGAKRSRPLEISRAAGPLRSSTDNVTTPSTPASASWWGCWLWRRRIPRPRSTRLFLEYRSARPVRIRALEFTLTQRVTDASLCVDLLADDHKSQARVEPGRHNVLWMVRDPNRRDSRQPSA